MKTEQIRISKEEIVRKKHQMDVERRDKKFIEETTAYIKPLTITLEQRMALREERQVIGRAPKMNIIENVIYTTSGQGIGRF